MPSMASSKTVQLPSALKEQWRLGRLLGKGGQGAVYFLHSLDGNQDAVIKFLLDDSEYRVERFRREIEAQSSISHPNVLTILTHEMKPVPFYVAPRGQALDQQWEAIRKSSDATILFERSAHIISQLAQGLAVVHEKNLVHRDIKPKNIIVFDEGRPVLADFGIVHNPLDERITRQPAGNTFARDLGSLYDPTLAPPSGDCFCLASVWAWMLAADPRLQHGNYHWRFHKFVDDERCEIARAMLALCSEPSICPKNGTEFCELLEKRLSLLTLAMPPSASSTTSSTKAYAMALAQRELLTVATHSEMQVLALAIMPSLQLLVSTIRDSAQHLSAQGLPVTLHVTGLSNPLAQQDVLDAILSTEKERVPHVLASLTCGDDNVMDFGVSLAAVWHKYPHQDGSKFSMDVQFFHEGVPEIQQLYSSSSNVLTTGELEGFDVIRTVSAIRDFFQDGSQWRTRTAPRPRGPGFFLG